MSLREGGLGGVAVCWGEGGVVLGACSGGGHFLCLSDI